MWISKPDQTAMAFLRDRALYQKDGFLRVKMEKQHASTEDFSCLIGSYSNNNKNVLSFFSLLEKLPVS